MMFCSLYAVGNLHKNLEKHRKKRFRGFHLKFIFVGAFARPPGAISRKSFFSWRRLAKVPTKMNLRWKPRNFFSCSCPWMETPDVHYDYYDNKWWTVQKMISCTVYYLWQGENTSNKLTSESWNLFFKKLFLLVTECDDLIEERPTVPILTDILLWFVII